MTIWNILRTFRIFNDNLVHIVLIWYIFSSFGVMYQEKSGNPAALCILPTKKLCEKFLQGQFAQDKTRWVSA
jgi:hypothetical protein